jgi:hypothetical protein
VAVQHRARHSAHSCNMAASRDAREAAQWRQEEDDRGEGGSVGEGVREPVPPSDDDIIEVAQCHRRQVHEDYLRCRLETRKYGGGAGGSGAGNSGTY